MGLRRVREWREAYTRRISPGASVALIIAGTAIAYGATVWGLLPRRPVASRWEAAEDLMTLLSGPETGPAWFIAPLALATAGLFPALVCVLAPIRASRFRWIGSAGAGVVFAIAATGVTGFLLGLEMAILIDGEPPMSLPIRLLLPLLGLGMAPPVALLLLPLPMIAGGALFGLLAAAFVRPIDRVS